MLPLVIAVVVFVHSSLMKRYSVSMPSFAYLLTHDSRYTFLNRESFEWKIVGNRGKTLLRTDCDLKNRKQMEF